jgi:hypothetical protein
MMRRECDGSMRCGSEQMRGSVSIVVSRSSRQTPPVAVAAGCARGPHDPPYSTHRSTRPSNICHTADSPRVTLHCTLTLGHCERRPRFASASAEFGELRRNLDFVCLSRIAADWVERNQLYR